MTMEEAINLRALGGRVRDHFTNRDGQIPRPVEIRRVLCWWCREMHHPAEVEKCMALPRKMPSSNGNGSSTSSAMMPGVLAGHSELWAFLTATTYPDGTKRRTGRLSLSCDVDMLGLALLDEDNQQYAFLNGRDLTSLLDEAELRLADGSLTFKPSKWKSSAKR